MPQRTACASKANLVVAEKELGVCTCVCALCVHLQEATGSLKEEATNKQLMSCLSLNK